MPVARKASTAKTFDMATVATSAVTQAVKWLCPAASDSAAA